VSGIHININSFVCRSARFSGRPPSQHFDTLPKFNAKNATINSAKPKQKMCKMQSVVWNVKCGSRKIWHRWLAFEKPVNPRVPRNHWHQQQPWL